MKLIDMGFPSSYMEDAVRAILENLNDNERVKQYDTFEELNFVFADEEERKKFEVFIEPITQKVDNINENGRTININSIINGENGWGEKLGQYCINNKGDFLSRKEFFNLIEIGNLIESIKVSNTKDISDLRRSITAMYNFHNIKEFYKKDLEKLEDFTNNIDKIIISKKIIIIKVKFII